MLSFYFFWILLLSVAAQPTPSDHCLTYNDNYGVCQKCIQTYYLQIYFCLPCSPLCKCSNGSNFCQQCVTISKGHYQLYTFYNSTLNRCYYCSDFMSYCAYCVNSTVCLTCYGGYLVNSSTGQCGSNTCTANCQICNSSSTCSVCQLGYYNNAGSCGTSNCTSNCHTCNSSTTCKTCLPTFYSSSGVCQQCMPQCLTCTNSSDCQVCEPGYVYQNDSCQNTTLSNCVVYAANYTVCLDCQPGYYILAGSCSQCTGCDLCTGMYLCQSVCQEGYTSFYYNCIPNGAERLVMLMLMVVIDLIIF